MIALSLNQKFSNHNIEYSSSCLFFGFKDNVVMLTDLTHLLIKKLWISTVDKMCMAYGYIRDKVNLDKLTQSSCTTLNVLSTEKKHKKQFNLRDLSVNWHLSTRLTMMMNYIYNLMYL